MAYSYDSTEGLNFSYYYYITHNITWNRMNVAAAAVTSSLAIIGIVGNALVVYIVFKYRDMHTVTNMYIMNLAKTDICFLVVCALPTASQLVNGGVWNFGEFMCRFTAYIQSVTVQATCATLTMMALDRYFVIYNPLKARARRTKKAALTIIAIIWLASFLMHIPMAVYTEVMIDPYFLTPACVPTMAMHVPIFAKCYDVYAVLVMYAIPLYVITICTTCIINKICNAKLPAKLQKSRNVRQRVESDASGEYSTRRVVTVKTEDSIEQKWRITLMVLIVVIFFVVCWGPVHAVTLYYTFVSPELYDMQTMMPLSAVALCLSYLNSCVNPFVYAFVGNNYRRHLAEIVRCAACKKRHARKNQRSAFVLTSRSLTKTILI
ncbi:G-protein coupled receptor 54-like [Saccoglossus kowalevskii]|uniref:G-protein coupled receptor 54-like n=1 Tax=Saccoglossus kowalevskii TaxID=10224 RepID=A0ABM0MVG5_SACKO|nr:PREDICTED: G-protein coupled receptor 54-like [Saccoglossus kowalevskii]